MTFRAALFSIFLFSISARASIYTVKCVIVKDQAPAEHLKSVKLDTSHRATSTMLVGGISGYAVYVGVGEGHAAGPDTMGMQIQGPQTVTVSTMMNDGFAYLAYQLDKVSIDCTVSLEK